MLTSERGRRDGTNLFPLYSSRRSVFRRDFVVMDHLSTTYRDPNAHRYLNTHIRDRHHCLLMDRILEDVFGIEAKDRVLEVGAGSGRYTETLLGRGCHVRVRNAYPIGCLAWALRSAGPNSRGAPIRFTVV